MTVELLLSPSSILPLHERGASSARGTMKPQFERVIVREHEDENWKTALAETPLFLAATSPGWYGVDDKAKLATCELLLLRGPGVRH